MLGRLQKLRRDERCFVSRCESHDAYLHRIRNLEYVHSECRRVRGLSTTTFRCLLSTSVPYDHQDHGLQQCCIIAQLFADIVRVFPLTLRLGVLPEIVRESLVPPVSIATGPLAEEMFRKPS
jgi:hypothetical protein